MAATRGGRRRRSNHPTNHHPLKPKSKPILNRHSLISAAISATISATAFLNRHDLTLLPSQSLTLISLLNSLSKSLSLSPPPHPSFFHRLLVSPFSESLFPRFFNMSKSSFSILLRLLTPSLSTLHVAPSAALAATLFRLAHDASYKSIARMFDLGSDEAGCKVFYSVIKAIHDKLFGMFEFQSDIGRVVVGFRWMDLPNCCGVLGFDRFPIGPPQNGNGLLGENGALLVQALVDSEGRFLDVSAGWPSTMKPDKILRHSKLFSKIEEYLTGDCFNLNEDDDKSSVIPQYLLGDSCLPLLPWLITPYTEPANGDIEKTDFNSLHKRGMDLVETAFGRVREMWKIVSGKWREECIEYFPFVVVTCCLLHNYLIKCSEPFQSLEEDVEYESGKKPHVFEGEEDGEGKRIRDALASHLNRVRLTE